MKGISPEIIQFFEEHGQFYDFLLHRTHHKSDVLSIMKHGLFFEDKLNKVTDEVTGNVECALIGNSIFLKSFGQYIVILAFPKSLDYYDEHFARSASMKSLATVFSDEEVSNFTDMHWIPPQYVLGYNESFGRKLVFNKLFERVPA